MAGDDEKLGGVSFTTTSISDGDNEAQYQPRKQQHRTSPARTPRTLQRWTTVALMISYFVFSIALYTLFDHPARKAFWFVYLGIATVIAGITALEAYDGLTPLREARKAICKADGADWKFKVADAELPTLHIIIDAPDTEDLDDIDDFAYIADDIAYPEDKVLTSVLQCPATAEAGPTIDYIGEKAPGAVRVLSVPSSSASSLASRIAYCLTLESYGPEPTVTAILRSDERPHPHSIRFAVEKMVQDAKVDVVQGRNVKATAGGLLGSLISIQHDLVQALLRPGRCLTWGLNMPGQVDAYWRTEALRTAATASALNARDGLDLACIAVSNNLRTVYDLRVVSYSSCPSTWSTYWTEQITVARELAIASIRYATLAFKRHKAVEGETKPKWSMKIRVAIFYTLILSRLASHTVLQYLSMELALLFTRTPHSGADLARLLYFPYPVSVWLVCIGVLCLVATVGMMYRARNEFVALWTAPVMVIVYPLLLVLQAGADVFGQLDAVVW